MGKIDCVAAIADFMGVVVYKITVNAQYIDLGYVVYLALNYTEPNMKFYRVNNKPYLKLRIIATIIDYGIFCILFYFFVSGFGQPKEDGSTEVTGSLVLVIPTFWFLYFVVLEATNGATPGHDICKLKVFKTDGSKVSLSDAFKRRICDPIDIMMYGIPAFICISKTEKHQRLGDLLADTVVANASDVVETEVIF
jgi:uncharacterized RDD family membrane protein YckC